MLWILRDSYYTGVLTGDGVNRIWWGVFTTASFFSNVGIIPIEIDLAIGYTLTPNEMMPFQQAVFPLLIGSFIMIAG